MASHAHIASAAFLCLAACSQSNLAECAGGLICPEGSTCAPTGDRCVTPEEVVVTVVNGDAVVASAQDLEQLNHIKVIVGRLSISSPSLDVVELPELEEVGQGLGISMSSTLRRVSLPALRTVDSGGLTVAQNAALTDLDLPA